MKLRAGVGLTAVLWASGVWAADKIVIGPQEAWVRPAAIPDAGTATQTPLKILLTDRELRFSSRTEEMYVEDVVKIQSAQGLGAVGTLTVAWNPDNDRVIVHKLQILRAGVRIDLLASGQKFTIARRETNLENAALDGTLTGVIQPPGLQVGDVLDFAYTVHHSDPVLAGDSEAAIGFAGNAVLSRVHIRAQWPSGQPIQWRARDGLSATVKQSAGMTSVTVQQDNLPTVVQPNGAPGRFVVNPRVEFSSFSSWGQLGRVLSPLYAKAAVIRPHSPLLAEIARIRSASPDPKVRAAMALALVENQVRYVFLGMNQGGLVPAPPDLTWSRRFGDCKAKTVLLTAMLKSLGIDATPVAVNTTLGDLLPGRLPMVELLDHVLVRTEIEGKTYWLDGTRLGDGSLDNLPVPYYHWGVPLTRTGGELVRLQPPPPTEPLVETSIRIDATAGTTAPAPFHVELIMRGDLGLLLKQRLANLASNQLNDNLRQFWTKLYAYVEVRGVSAAYDDQDAAEHWTMDGIARMDWSGYQRRLDELTIGYQPNFSRQPGPNEDAPYAVPYPVYVRSRETILLSDHGIGFSVAAPDVDRTVAGVEYHRHVALAGDVFTGEASQRSVATEFPASDAQAAQQALTDLSKALVYVSAPSGYSPTDQDVASGIPKTVATAGALTSRGNQLLQRRRFDEAIEDFNAALALNPHDANTLADRALSYIGKRDVPDALRDMSDAYALDAHNKYGFHGRGEIAMARGDYAAAVAAFTAALQVDAKDGFALSMRSRSELALGQRQQALADLNQAIALNPKQPELYRDRAMLWLSLGERAAALREPGLLLRADPGNSGAYFVAGELYAQLGQRSLAMQSLTRSIEIQPSDAAYLVRATLRPEGDLQDRRSDLEAAVRLNPDSANDLTSLALTAADDQDYEEAISASTRAMAIRGEASDLLAIRGVSYARSHQPALAENDFSAAVDKAKGARDLNNLCWRMATFGVDLDRALELCEAAVSKAGAPEKGDALDSRGLVLLRLGRCKEAIADYNASLAIKPLLPSSLYGRGVCEQRTGNRKAAAADLHDGELFSQGAVAADFKRWGVGP